LTSITEDETLTQFIKWLLNNNQGDSGIFWNGQNSVRMVQFSIWNAWFL